MTIRLSSLGLSPGKVPRRPSLDRYDNKSYRTAEGSAGAPTEFGTFLGLEREYASTHERDRDLLIALGVDGTVPLAQARRNAGLDVQMAISVGDVVSYHGVDYLITGDAILIGANDNHELAAQAA